jgi:hypothetical protein
MVYARSFSLPYRLRSDVVVVASRLEHPTKSGASSFEPGEVAGRAYLYDFAERRVVCAGDVHARSSNTIAYVFESGPTSPASQDQGPRLTASLEDDFRVQLEQATRASLVRLTP